MRYFVIKHPIWAGVLISAAIIECIEITKIARLILTEFYREFMCLRGKLPTCGAPVGDVLTCELHKGHQYRYHRATYAGDKFYRERDDV